MGRPSVRQAKGAAHRSPQSLIAALSFIAMVGILQAIINLLFIGGRGCALVHQNVFGGVTDPDVPPVAEHDNPHIVVRIEVMARVAANDIQMAEIFARQVEAFSQSFLHFCPD